MFSANSDPLYKVLCFNMKLEGKYSLESTDPRESKIRLVSGRELRTGSGLLDVFGQ